MKHLGSKREYQYPIPGRLAECLVLSGYCHRGWHWEEREINMVPGQLDLGWSMWCSKGTLFRSSLGQEEEVAKCLLQGQKKASRRDDLAVGVQQIANPFGVASQHKVPGAGYWACSKRVPVCPWPSLLWGWHWVCAIVHFTKTRIEGAEVSQWPECFLSSWGMFTEGWCFSKPLIRSTPCPPYLYFSKCVERTHCFCFLPAFQNILRRCEFHGFLWAWTALPELCPAIWHSGFPIRKTWLCGDPKTKAHQRCNFFWKQQCGWE